MGKNHLYYGDNLEVLRRYIDDESVDLVYLDPPFNSNATYNVLFAEQDGSQAASQIRAFEDTWTWNHESEETFNDVVTTGGRVSDCLQAFRTFLGECNMLAYLVMMAPRLVELRRVLKSTGSIYLHCDPTASHYLKMLMDAVFGADNYINEIIWHYNTGGASKKKFSNKHDVILYYTINREERVFNTQREPYREDKTDHFTETDEYGRKYRVRHIDGKDYIYYLDDGRICHDVWDIDALNASAKERLGYPTQKPVALLERILKASSNEGDVVLDPFCGCGTTIAAAQNLNRTWIGIDITHLAINLIKHRLLDAHGDIVYEVTGEPTSPADAEALAAADPYQFQWWALGLVGARPVEEKKGADKGIDGMIIFQGDKKSFKKVIISVKAGKTGSAHVRDLKGVLDRENAAIGVLISLQEPTGPMRTEATTSGFFESKNWGRRYPKVQLLTVAELLDGKAIDMPQIRQVNRTFKKATPAKKATPTTEEMF